MDMNHKNHTGNGLRWMEALAREQLAANRNTACVKEHPVIKAVETYVTAASKHGMPLDVAEVVTNNIANAVKQGFMVDIVGRDESGPSYYGVNFCPNCGERAPKNLHEEEGATYCGACDSDTH